MSKKHVICLLNDSFPPIIDGVANAVVNYARIIERDHGHAVVLTPHMSGSDDSIYDFDIVRYPSIDTRRLIGYVTGYPFSPDAANAGAVSEPIIQTVRAKQSHFDLPFMFFPFSLHRAGAA